MNKSELQKRYFAALKEKYQVGWHENAASDSFLSLILRKAELDIQITSLEFEWLAEKRLLKTIEIISLQQYQVEEQERLEAELQKLRSKYQVTEALELSITSPVYSILWKLDAGYILTDSEFELLKNQGLVDTIILIQEILNFSRLKVNYKATKHLNQLPEEPLYSILKKLDAKEHLTNSEADWLLELDFEETLEIHWQRENTRKAELEFLELKSKFQVYAYAATSISSPLYAILKKLNLEEELEKNECEWLEQQNLSDLIAIDQTLKNRRFFAVLKDRYKATQYQGLDPAIPLFAILKKLLISESQENQISEKDIQWLSEQGLVETVAIAKIIHFRALKRKYRILGKLDGSDFVPLYEIMLKLEREERLDPKQVIQLIEEKCLWRYGKIAIAYYRLEAIFYEKEHQRTGNKWNLPTASSNWRKAEEPERALKVTANVNWNKIQESNLKSALWVTRGAAFRDLNQLDEAENCATQAIECQSNSYQPYTLMGAICYDRGEYPEGDKWFKTAAKHGAKDKDIDDEIARIVRMTKDKKKRKEVVEYLLNKDPHRYAWASSYL